MTVILLLFSVWVLEKDYPGVVPVKIAFGLCQVTFINSVFNWQMLTLNTSFSFWEQERF